MTSHDISALGALRIARNRNGDRRAEDRGTPDRRGAGDAIHGNYLDDRRALLLALARTDLRLSIASAVASAQAEGRL